MTDSFWKQVADEIPRIAQGWTATLEFPGFVDITIPGTVTDGQENDDRHYLTGPANNDITIDAYEAGSNPADGDPPATTLSTGLNTMQQQDPWVVAVNVVATIARYEAEL